MAPGATVTGHLTTKQGVRAKLQITWPHPSQDEAGRYKCDIITFRAQGHADVFSQRLDITKADVTISDIVHKVQELYMEKEKLKITVEEQSRHIRNMMDYYGRK